MKQRCAKCGLLMSYPGATTEESAQGVCDYCKNFKRKEFKGEELLKKEFNEKEKIGVTVSGGKDSIFVWNWAVQTFGADRVIAFNHRKVGMVHPLAAANIEKASEILQSKIIYMDDEEFYPRFIRNLRTYINHPDAAILRAVVCAGCRYGISNAIFEKCNGMGIEKVINGSSYLEAAPFKSYHMGKFGEGNETRGLLKGIISEDEYLEKNNIQTIIRDHFNCHEKDLANKKNEYGIKYIDFYDYIENKPQEVKRYVEKYLEWKHPDGQSWRFDCLVEEFKQILFLAAYGYSELDFKYSQMVRYDLISKDSAIESVQEKNMEVINRIDELAKILKGFKYDGTDIMKFYETCLPLLTGQ